MTEDNEDFFSFTVDYWLGKVDQAGKLDKSISAQCRVCQDEVVRNLVNRLLALMFTAPDVVDILEGHNNKLLDEGKPLITLDCVKNHRSRHFEAQVPSAVVMRKLAEKNAARKKSQNIDEMSGTMLDAKIFHETVAQKAYQTLTDPHMVVGIGQGVVSINWLHEQEKREEEGRDMAHMQAEYARMIEVIRHYIPQAKWPEVISMLRGEAIERAKAEPVKSVRVVSIDDTPEEGEVR